MERTGQIRELRPTRRRGRARSSTSATMAVTRCRVRFSPVSAAHAAAARLGDSPRKHPAAPQPQPSRCDGLGAVLAGAVGMGHGVVEQLAAQVGQRRRMQVPPRSPHCSGGHHHGVDPLGVGQGQPLGAKVGDAAAGRDEPELAQGVFVPERRPRRLGQRRAPSPGTARGGRQAGAGAATAGRPAG